MLAAGGTLATGVYMVAVAPGSPNGKVTPLWNWWGLADPANNPVTRGWLTLAAAVALVCWLLCWWGLYRVVGRVGRRLLPATGIAWALPLIAGPPLLSLDAYAYVAQGRMVQLGLNPYRLGPIALGQGHILGAVDPLWRHAPTPYGPLLLRAQASAVELAGAHPVVAIYVFRLLVVLALAGTGWLVARVFRQLRDRDRALLLVPLNPVLLVFLLSGAHLDALMAVLSLAALVAARAGRIRLGIVLAAVAVALKMPAVVVVAVLVVADVAGRRGLDLARRAVADTALAGAVLVACSFAVPDGFGWLKALGTPAKVSAGYAPAELFAGLVHLALLPLGVHSSSGELLVVRAVFAAAGAGLVAWLCLTVRRRGRAATAALGLLVVALAAPVLYSWYLAWGMLPAALLVRRTWGRRVLFGASAVGLVGMVPDLGLLTTEQRHVLAALLAAPALVAALGWLAARWYAARQRPVGQPRTAPVAVRRAPRWSLGALVAAGGVLAMSAPAIAVPTSVRQTAQLLTGGRDIAQAWLVGSDYYVLMPAAPVPEQQPRAPLVLDSNGGAAVPRCPVGPLPAADALSAEPGGAPAVVYSLGTSACWRPALDPTTAG